MKLQTVQLYQKMALRIQVVVLVEKALHQEDHLRRSEEKNVKLQLNMKAFMFSVARSHARSGDW